MCHKFVTTTMPCYSLWGGEDATYRSQMQKNDHLSKDVLLFTHSMLSLLDRSGFANTWRISIINLSFQNFTTLL